jgi:hypothetical protein
MIAAFFWNGEAYQNRSMARYRVDGDWFKRWSAVDIWARSPLRQPFSFGTEYLYLRIWQANMKKLSLGILLLVASGWTAFGQQTSGPALFWVEGDFGWNGRALGAGASIDTGYLVAKNLYFDLSGSFLLSDNTSLLFVAGFKIFPPGHGLVAGLRLGGGDIQTHGVDNWGFASTAEFGYSLGWVVLGTKVSLYLTNIVQATVGLFVGLT